jgi:hypothetical protein
VQLCFLEFFSINLPHTSLALRPLDSESDTEEFREIESQVHRKRLRQSSLSMSLNYSERLKNTNQLKFPDYNR